MALTVMASNLFASPRCLHAQVLMAMNIFTATHTCVMVYINDHRLYCILASLYRIRGNFRGMYISRLSH